MDSNSYEELAAPNEEQNVTTEERDRIKKELSTMSFEDLRKLQDKLGAKVYNETVYGVRKQTKTKFKRTNKNRPREVSSKRPIDVKQSIVAVKPQAARDPRFDPLCGSYDEKLFKSNYKFLHGMKKNERKELEKELESTEDPDRKNQIKLLMQRLDNQIREQEKRDKLRESSEIERTDIKRKLKRGEKPVFKKKSEKKLDNLVEKYEELKKSNKLQKHIEKRLKKIANKDRKQYDGL